jgi:tRNA-dihydrouridine synthase A
LDDARTQLAFVDGVMMGRAAYQNPELLLGVDPILFDEPARYHDSRAALEAYLPYVASQLDRGVPLAAMTRHLLGLFAGQPGARAYRRILATEAVKPGAGIDVIARAIVEIERTGAVRALAA